MNQKKIGYFLRKLRNEKGLTQEQFAEIIGVSNRSVSRWENGVNMPDFDLLIQIAEYFDVHIEEILDGERKAPASEKETKNTLLKVADYSTNENIIFSKRLNYIFLMGLAAYIVYMLIDIQDLTVIPLYDNIASFALGLVLGVLLVGVLYTSRYISKIKAFKMRLLKRDK